MRDERLPKKVSYCEFSVMIRVCSTVSPMLSGLETKSLVSKQGVNVTCSRPQRTATRPGREPGTPWSVVRDANHCVSPPPGADTLQSFSEGLKHTTSNFDKEYIALQNKGHLCDILCFPWGFLLEPLFFLIYQ